MRVYSRKRESSSFSVRVLQGWGAIKWTVVQMTLSLRTPLTGRMGSPPLLVALLLLAFVACGEPDLSSDRAALLALRDAVGQGALLWNATDSPCAWQGVVCQQNRVIILRLPGVGLIGVIPAGTVGNLTALRTLSLRYNGLSGGLPSDLDGAAQLRNLYLQDNRLSGEIPPVLFSLKKLVRLNLAGNGFTGGISPGFNNLSRLGTLYLEKNQLTGSIPELDLPNLVQFNVSFNRLNGSVPSKFRKLPKSAFMGMSLCGGPLPPCPGEVSPAPAPAAPGPTSGETGGGGSGGGSGSKLSGGAIAGIAVGSVALVLILLILLVFVCRRSSGRKTRAVESAAVAAKPPEAEGAVRSRGDVVLSGAAATAAVAAGDKKTEIGKRLVFFGRAGVGEFDLEDLLRASAEVLGKGTFGTSYKAVLEIGTVVAVKRLRDVNLPEQEFRERIEAVGSMYHDNLVPLRAYYYSKDEKLLVYDYMPMGSLSALLHGNRGSGRTPLNWETRLSIALGAARGIAYIHSISPTTSHGNIKSSNILLSKTYDACVSDHGLASLASPSTTPSRIAGYRAPEVTDVRKISQKADLYSFGVLLLELLTGKAPAQALLNEEGVDLPRWVQSVVREEWSSEVFDLELLRYQNVEEEMVQLLQLAIDCTSQYPDSRPSISEVISRIERIHSSNEGVEEIEEPPQQHPEPSSVDGAHDHSSNPTGAADS
ncbi:putative inactive receptor kinase [Apostasia shenzhenica]|uniref:Putative inactive receptor kinase n=1 Tax=Apostasia shenzhenica TaxID=1088818 RepID=A0A2I0B4K2_9ASPA|nr:putative inactive receptor kinase [Apostasia shenzhenica]